MLQRTPSHCITLHHTTQRCTALHHTAPHCDTLQHTATHCNTLHHAAPRCTILHIAPHRTTLQHTCTHEYYNNTPTSILPCMMKIEPFHWVYIYIYILHTATHCNTLQIHVCKHTHFYTIMNYEDSAIVRSIHIYMYIAHCNALQYTATYMYANTPTSYTTYHAS